MSGITSGGSWRSPSIVTTAVSTGRLDASRERDLVAEVAREPDEANVRVDRRDLDEARPRPVGGAVVHDHDLVWARAAPPPQLRARVAPPTSGSSLRIGMTTDSNCGLRYSGHGIPGPRWVVAKDTASPRRIRVARDSDRADPPTRSVCCGTCAPPVPRPLSSGRSRSSTSCPVSAPLSKRVFDVSLR